MLLYGRGVRERSESYWLKASYFTLKFHPLGFGYLVTVHQDSPCLKMYYSTDCFFDQSKTLMLLGLMVAMDNFEMSTYRLSSECSAPELHGCVGTPGRNQTSITAFVAQRPIR